MSAAGLSAELVPLIVGTNRCPIQTGGKGIDGLPSALKSDCQHGMDKLLEELVATLQPRSVILAGRHAIGWLYASSSPTKVRVSSEKLGGHNFIKIPIYHPSAWTPPNARSCSQSRMAQGLKLAGVK